MDINIPEHQLDTYSDWQQHEFTQRSLQMLREQHAAHIDALKRAASVSSDPDVRHALVALKSHETWLAFFAGGKR